jgi:uncharacterized surface protein with fasciclin (FAS1) repeats
MKFLFPIATLFLAINCQNSTNANNTVGSLLQSNQNATLFAKVIQNQFQNYSQALSDPNSNFTLFAPQDWQILVDRNSTGNNATSGTSGNNTAQVKGTLIISVNPVNSSESLKVIAQYENYTEINPDFRNVTFGPNNTSFNHTLDCLVAYHIVPNISFSIWQPNMTLITGNQSMESQANETKGFSVVLPTAFNNSMVQLPKNSSQVVVLKHFSNLTLVYFGAFPPAIVVQQENATNGYMFVLDRALIPPFNVSTTLKIANLSMFAEAVQKLNLTDYLDSTPGLTIFAPTNRALQRANFSSLNDTEAKGLLLSHIIAFNESNSNSSQSGSNSSENSNSTQAKYAWYSPYFVNVTSSLPKWNQSAIALNSVNGTMLTVRALNLTRIYVNSSRIVRSDVIVSNGVIHIINDVLGVGGSLGPVGDNSTLGIPPVGSLKRKAISKH